MMAPRPLIHDRLASALAPCVARSCGHAHACAGATAVSPALSQEMLAFPARPKPAPKPHAPGGQQQMLVRHRDHYDYTNDASRRSQRQLYSATRRPKPTG